MRLSLKSTSTRTFVVWPALVAAEQVIARRPVRVSWLPMLLWGYLQYRWSGAYRSRLGGGGPGMSRPPERIVTTGVYGWTRNPMYLGHQIFLAGLALATRSPLATALFMAHIPWFAARARDDEHALGASFGTAYESYRRSVPRWFWPAEPVRRVFRGTGTREVSWPAEPVRRVFRGTGTREVSLTSRREKWLDQSDRSVLTFPTNVRFD